MICHLLVSNHTIFDWNGKICCHKAIAISKSFLSIIWKLATWNQIPSFFKACHSCHSYSFLCPVDYAVPYRNCKWGESEKLIVIVLLDMCFQSMRSLDYIHFLDQAFNRPGRHVFWQYIHWHSNYVVLALSFVFPLIPLLLYIATQNS